MEKRWKCVLNKYSEVICSTATFKGEFYLMLAIYNAWAINTLPFQPTGLHSKSTLKVSCHVYQVIFKYLKYILMKGIKNNQMTGINDAWYKRNMPFVKSRFVKFGNSCSFNCNRILYINLKFKYKVCENIQN